MPEYSYQDVEAWNTATRLAAAVGRLKVGSNLKASADAHGHAFEQAALAAALIADGTSREGPGAQSAAYREARGALAQCRSWLHTLALLINEPDSVFGNELDLAEQAARQLGGMLRTIDRAPAPGMRPGGPPPMRDGGRPVGPREGGRPPGPPRDRDRERGPR